MYYAMYIFMTGLPLILLCLSS